ncbi:type IV conjugative transfer system lipoprotein TraV [Erwinia amylovora]|uniref:type IV conjugative transfer system lipoprotein TraV n=1 Tax=Erwinia amylovora TaxID=552 RepID=UPI0020C0FEF9|nr:type IV conjugative transfer system lipoprotein TraV [Erwinia amylovora]MCK8417595.1 type IV conjugative transfer system lipoprotein TraV [Erwinia amylovora]
MKKIIFLLSATALLSGCAGMNDDFDCNKTATDQCLTMEQAQGLASQGKSLDDLDASKGGSEKKVVSETVATKPLSNNKPVIKSYINPVESGSTVKSSLFPPQNVRPVISTTPIRVIEKVNPNSAGSVNSIRYQDVTQRIWISPWVDKDDSFHQPSIVEFVSEHSSWKKEFNSIGNGG